MNIQDIINALVGGAQKVGLGPPLAGLPNMESMTPNQQYNTSNNYSGPAHDWVTQDTGTSLSTGAGFPVDQDAYLASLRQDGRFGNLVGPAPGPVSGVSVPPPTILDRLRGIGLDLPLGPIQQPRNEQIAAMSQPGGTGQLPSISGAPPPMGPGLAGNESASSSMWNSILNALSPSQNADPTQNAELGASDPNWLYNTFGIGKAPVKPQEPGVLDRLAGDMNAEAANAPKAGAGAGGGSITSMGLGQYQEPPPAPHEAVPPGMDLSKVMEELRAAEPQRVPLSTTKGENILEGLAHGMASAAGHGFGTQLLAGAAGGLGGQIGYEHEQQRDEQNFQHAMQDFHYRMAEGELHQAQIGSEHDKLKAEIDYKNEMNDYQRSVSIIAAHQPQAEMTAGGLLVRSINPKTGQYQVQLDSRPIDHIIAARMALRGMGASQAAVSSFTGLATGASGHQAGPEDAALNLAMNMLDRPGIWPAVLGPKFNDFNASITQNMGKSSAYGTMSEQMKGKAGEAIAGARAQTAVVRALQNMILNDPTGETAKRAVGLLTGQGVVGDKNAVVANPYHH